MTRIFSDINGVDADIKILQALKGIVAEVKGRKNWKGLINFSVWEVLNQKERKRREEMKKLVRRQNRV